MEPAEVLNDSTNPIPTRQRELLAPEKEEGSKAVKYGMIGGGASLSLGGMGVLSFTHWDFLLPFLPDVAGLSMVGVGASMAIVAANPESVKRDGKSSLVAQFELVPLNDEIRFAPTADAIAKTMLCGEGGKASSTTKVLPSLALNKAAEDAIKTAERVASEANKAARKQAEEQALSALTEQLEAGELEPRRLRQQLAPRCFVIDFDTRPPPSRGPGRPAVPPSTRVLLEDLRQQVSLILHTASPYDEVILRITSPGGPVTDYGLAAAEFGRLKSAGVKTTACVDLVAASGGYMIACAADQILAAPFSIVGSIGVIAGVPNVHRLLDKGGIEYVQRTAGNFKRTINVFTPNTEEGLRKFDEELALVHEAFKEHVTEHRATKISDVAVVCTGETWLALHAEPLGLVDAITTSEAYIRTRQKEADVYLLRAKAEKPSQGLFALLNRVAAAVHAAADRVCDALAPIAGWSQQAGREVLDLPTEGLGGLLAGSPQDRSRLDRVLPATDAAAMPLLRTADDPIKMPRSR